MKGNIIMDDFIEEYQLELDKAKEVPNTSILYPLCQCYEVEIASKITGYHMYWYAFLRHTKEGYIPSLEDLLDDAYEFIADGCFESYALWVSNGGGDEHLEIGRSEEWTKQYWLYARYLYTELEKLVGEDGRAELLNA